MLGVLLRTADLWWAQWPSAHCYPPAMREERMPLNRSHYESKQIDRKPVCWARLRGPALEITPLPKRLDLRGSFSSQFARRMNIIHCSSPYSDTWEKTLMPFLNPGNYWIFNIKGLYRQKCIQEHWCIILEDLKSKFKPCNGYTTLLQNASEV